MSSSKSPRLLFLCDSPVPSARRQRHLTGFGRVADNLIRRWSASGVEIDVWGIGFDGWGYKNYPAQIFPAGNHDWNSEKNLNAFLNILGSGDYTHVVMLMDADALSAGNFPSQFRACCKKHGIKSLLYFPVDCDQQEEEWLGIIQVVDVAVTFTNFGAQVVRRTLGKSLYPVQVVPHGMDEHFKPQTREERMKWRSQIVVNGNRPFATEKDFLILVVNKNEHRKDLFRSLEILALLKTAGIPAKMLFRTDELPTATGNGIHLLRAADQLGLKYEDDYSRLNGVPEEFMPNLYATADLYLTTSLGEGWGLGITEALACGVPVALPEHTSCYEIAEQVLARDTDRLAIIPLELEDGHICGHDSRIRRRVNHLRAAQSIVEFIAHKGASFELPTAVREWLSWDRIANEFLALMGITPKRKSNLRVEVVISVREKNTTNTKGKMKTVQITTEQLLPLSVKFTDAAGIIANIVGAPTFASDNPAAATVDANGLVTSVAPGVANISVSAEGDPTPGVDTVKDSIQVTVVAPEATQAEIIPGTPTLKTAAAPATGGAAS